MQHLEKGSQLGLLLPHRIYINRQKYKKEKGGGDGKVTYSRLDVVLAVGVKRCALTRAALSNTRVKNPGSVNYADLANPIDENCDGDSAILLYAE